MIARHLGWHVGVAAVAVVVLTAVGVPLAAALPIGLMAGCMAMVVHLGYGAQGHAASKDDRAPTGPQHPDERRLRPRERT